MKALVVYYSFEGNTRLIANAIAAAIDFMDPLQVDAEGSVQRAGEWAQEAMAPLL